MSQQIVYEGGGNAHVTVEMILPDFTGLEAETAQAVARATQTVSTTMVQETLIAFPDPAFADAFSAIYGAQGGQAVAGVRIRNEIWHLVEKDTAPHVAPIERLKRWAEAHDANPYQVRAGIAQHGTTGRHAMPAILDRGVLRLRAAVDLGMKGVLDAR
jgi:hypothetical protein